MYQFKKIISISNLPNPVSGLILDQIDGVAMRPNMGPLGSGLPLFHNKTFNGLLMSLTAFCTVSYKFGLVETLIDRLFKMSSI